MNDYISPLCDFAQTLNQRVCDSWQLVLETRAILSASLPDDLAASKDCAEAAVRQWLSDKQELESHLSECDICKTYMAQTTGDMAKGDLHTA